LLVLVRAGSVRGRSPEPRSEEKTVSLEILAAKSAIKELVDVFANLADETRISERMSLFTANTKVQI